MKIIDFHRKGNLVRFSMGRDDCNDYDRICWGNRPYDKYIDVYSKCEIGYVDICFPFNYSVAEPSYSDGSRSWSKYDMKHGIVPCIVAVPDSDITDFITCLCAARAEKIYFNDSYNKLVSMFGKFIIDTVLYDGANDQSKSGNGGESK